MKKLILLVAILVIAPQRALATDYEIGGYLPISEGTANLGAMTSSTLSLAFMHNTCQIRQAAVCTKIKIYMSLKDANLSGWTLSMLRKNVHGTYNVVYSEDFLGQIGTGTNSVPGIQTLMPSTPWNVLPGDLPMVKPRRTGSVADYMTSVTSPSGCTSSGCDLAMKSFSTDPGITNIRAVPTRTRILPIKFYTDTPPHMAVISMGQFQGAHQEDTNTQNISGADLGVANARTPHAPSINPSLDPAWQIAQHFGWTYQNMTQSTAAGVFKAPHLNTVTEARFASDLLAYVPKVAILDGGWGLIDACWQNIDNATITARFRREMSSIVSIEAIPIVILSKPNGKYFANGGMARADAMDKVLKGICTREFPTAIVIEPQHIIGAERTIESPRGGSAGDLVAGNLWDYAAGYSDDGGDMPNAAGYTALANAIILALHAQAGYIDNGGGTGLMWQQATAPCNYTWEQALACCDNVILAGHTDWRLPMAKELVSIVDTTILSLSINTTYFPCKRASYYWSSTTGTGNTACVWNVDFTDRGLGYSSKAGSHYIRAERDGQSGSFGD